MSERETAVRIGEALGRLRREKGLSQSEAGARIGMTSQGWSLYEGGHRAGLFRPDMLRRLTSALDATPEELMLLVMPSSTVSEEAPTANGVASRGRSFEVVPPLPRQRYRLETDEMAPWAFAGTTLEYETGRTPRARNGCILTLQNGERLVRLWVKSDESSVVVAYAQGLKETFSRQDIREIGVVTARIDQD